MTHAGDRSTSSGRSARPPSGGARRHRDSTERRDLLARVASGDQAAREVLLEDHLDLVLAVAREQATGGADTLSSADLFQEGTIGLLAAIDSYSSAGVGDFESFARSHIASEMAAAQAAEEDAQQQGRDVVAAAEAYQRAEFQVRREQGRQGTIEEIAHLLEWTEDRTEEVATMVSIARRQHDEDLLQYLDAEDVPPDQLPDLIEGRATGTGDEPDETPPSPSGLRS